MPVEQEGLGLDPRARAALVTGSARRNGRDLALWLAGRGARVAVHYLSSEADARATLSDCNRLTPGGVLLRGDLTDADEAARVVQEAEQALGGLDVLVNNVGNYLRKPLLELSPREWRDQIESNLYAAWWCMSAALPGMRARGFGRIVNLGYAASERPNYNRLTVPYHIAKTGLAVLTRSAAAAVAKDGVTVNTIGVGIMDNSLHKPVSSPSGRLASAQDLCRALSVFVGPGSEHVNGAQLDVSGGWVPEQIL
jgi:3-oxoacyl-[acyl-carrier protein] reductase